MTKLALTPASPYILFSLFSSLFLVSKYMNCTTTAFQHDLCNKLMIFFNKIGTVKTFLQPDERRKAVIKGDQLELVNITSIELKDLFNK